MKPKRPLRPTTTSYSDAPKNETNQDNGNVSEEQTKPIKEVNKISNPFVNTTKSPFSNVQQQQKEENSGNPPSHKLQRPTPVTSLPPTQSEVSNKINNNVSNNSRGDMRSEVNETGYDPRKVNSEVQQEQPQKEIKKGNIYTASETSQAHSKHHIIIIILNLKFEINF